MDPDSTEATAMSKGSGTSGVKAPVVIVFVFFCIAGPLIYFTTAGNRHETGPVIVQVQMFEGPEFRAMIPTVHYWNRHYGEKTGILVEAKALDRVGYFDKLEIQLVAGQAQPDIVHPFSLQLGRLHNYLYPMDAYLRDNGIMTAPDGAGLKMDAILPIALETVKSPDGKTYMIPNDMSVILLYYRKDLIREPPQTWDAYTELAKKFTRTINPDSPTRYGTVMQGKYEMWTFCAALENLWPYGVDVFGALTDRDEDAVARGLATFEKLAGAGAFPGESVYAEYPEVASIIKKGDVAMAIQWNAFYNELTNKMLSPGVYDRFGLAPPPGVRKPDGSIERSIYVHTISLALNKNSRHKREAMKFLVWATLGRGAVIYAESGGSSPIREVWGDSTVSDLYPMILGWVEDYGRAISMNPDLKELMMIGSGWIQRVMAGEVTSRQAAAGLIQQYDDFRADDGSRER